jgi:hypothetical protein
VRDLRPESARRELGDPCADFLASAPLEHVGAREHDDSRAPQAGQRLPQSAPGKNPPEAERFQGIDEHDVQVAVDPPMLEAVVE